MAVAEVLICKLLAVPGMAAVLVAQPAAEKAGIKIMARTFQGHLQVIMGQAVAGHCILEDLVHLV